MESIVIDRNNYSTKWNFTIHVYLVQLSDLYLIPLGT